MGEATVGQQARLSHWALSFLPHCAQRSVLSLTFSLLGLLMTSSPLQGGPRLRVRGQPWAPAQALDQELTSHSSLSPVDGKGHWGPRQVATGQDGASTGKPLVLSHPPARVDMASSLRHVASLFQGHSAGQGGESSPPGWQGPSRLCRAVWPTSAADTFLRPLSGQMGPLSLCPGAQRGREPLLFRGDSNLPAWVFQGQVCHPTEECTMGGRGFSSWSGWGRTRQWFRLSSGGADPGLRQGLVGRHTGPTAALTPVPLRPGLAVPLGRGWKCPKASVAFSGSRGHLRPCSKRGVQGWVPASGWASGCRETKTKCMTHRPQLPGPEPAARGAGQASIPLSPPSQELGPALTQLTGPPPHGRAGRI